MRSAVTIAVIIALGVPSAEAVVLNPRGTGQVLIYPYYTVNAGFGTLLSLVNTTGQGKALKIHVREGYNGRDVLVFNLYLSPFDTWVAQIFDTSSDGSGRAAMATNDNSCTVPAFPPISAGAAAFRDAGYTGANADGGPAGITRTREGYLEVIEMGTVTNDHHSTLNAITHGSSGVPSNCPQLIQAWTNGGYWVAEATTDIGVPSGGLYGAESIINVGEGLMYSINAEAIDGFSNTVQHTIPGGATPDLSSATKTADGTVSAFVPVGSGMVEAKYDHPEDAISALFMAGALYNEYVVDPGLNAMTDWIVTFPTKRFYTDPALVAGAAARVPFDVRFNSSYGGASSVPIGPLSMSREEAINDYGCGFLCPTLWPRALGYATNAVAINAGNSLFGSNLLILDAPLYSFDSGQMRIDLTVDFEGIPVPRHQLTSTDGIVLKGVPAIGFAAIDYVNGNVTPGTLANYSGAYRHRSTVACSATAPAVCP